MNIAIICLAIVCAGLLVWCWRLNSILDEFIDAVGDLALHVTEREDWENDTLEKHDRRIEAAEASACGAVSDKDKKLGEMAGKLEDLSKRMDEFEELAADAVKAQTDADLAWAEGVRSLAGFGAAIPRLNMENLNHE